MDFVTAKDKAAEWDISLRRVQIFCEQGRIEGVRRLGKIWIIPKNALRPEDLRFRVNKVKKAVYKMSSNFNFLAEAFPVLENLGSLAENYLYSDPNSCLYKMGIFAETVVNYMFELDGLTMPDSDNTPANRIRACLVSPQQ